ncbi:MAG: linear amide C-N hydrolase [Bacteroidota bacterium]
MKEITLTILLVFQSLYGLYCTTFVIKSENNLVFGRNLDWVSENEIIVVNQRNQQKQSIVFSPDEPVSWVSKYGSVTFNQFGKELPFGGINEKGLVVEVILANAEYPKTDDRKALNELQWIQYQLDNSSNLEEVIANDKIVRLSKINQELHFLVADKNGNIAVIEFIGGEMQVYKDDKLPFPVLENDTYEMSLQRYQDKQSTRFAAAAQKVMSYNERINPSVVDYSFDILRDVALDGSWSIVYDMKNMTIFFVTKSNQKRKKIDLKALDFSCDQETFVYDLEIENSGLINDKFIRLTHEINKAKMKYAIEKSSIILPTEIRNMFYAYHKTISCK